MVLFVVYTHIVKMKKQELVCWVIESTDTIYDKISICEIYQHSTRISALKINTFHSQLFQQYIVISIYYFIIEKNIAQNGRNLFTGVAEIIAFREISETDLWIVLK